MKNISEKGWLTRNFYILVAFYAVAIFLANDMFLPAIGSIATSLHSTKQIISYGVGAYLGGAFLLQFVAGPLSDKYGRRPSLIWGGVFFMVITFAISYSPNANVFLILRFLQGAGTCMFSAAGIASLNEYYSEEKAIKAISLTVNLIMLAPVMGPVLGALIIKVLPWQGIFGIDLVFVGIIIILIYLFMPETSDRKLASEITFLQSFEGIKIALRNKKFIAHSVSLALHSSMFIIWITIGTYMFIDNFGLSPQQYSFWQSPMMVAFIIGNSIAPYLAKKYHSYKIVNTMSKVMLVAVIIFIILNLVFGTNLTIFILTMSVVLFIRGLINAPYNQFVLSLERKYQGSSAASLSLINNGILTAASIGASALYGLQNISYVMIMMVVVVIAILITFKIGDK